MFLANFSGVSQFVPFSILILNCFIFNYTRKLVKAITPTKFWLLLSEIISTLELCSGCAELGIVWEKHGTTVYAISLFICYIWWAVQFGEAKACPCEPIEDYLLINLFQKHDIYVRLLGQLLGAYFAIKYRTYIWYLDIVTHHISPNENKCEAALQVSMISGLVIESVITFISRLVSLESHFWPKNFSLLINAIVTVGLCISALHTSGGFFNPILASALTLNCKGHTVFEHFMVYWIGALIGGILARYLHIWIHERHKLN